MHGTISRPVTVVAGFVALGVAGDGLAQVEEVIVSTRKRDENLQEVPIAVTAFSAEQAERLALNDVRDLSKLTPSLIFDQGVSPQDTRITIRGLAPIRGRQNVAVLQDGVDITSQSIGTGGGSLLVNPRLFDIERVEIVKGPQNALYGRSAFNGAINYVMRRPTEDLQVRVFSDLGANGRAEIRGGISGPLIGDTLLGDFSAAAWTFDGFYRSPVTNGAIGSQQGTAYAGSLQWSPTDRLSVRLRGEVLNDEAGPTAYRQIFGTTTLSVPAAATTPPGPGLLPVLSPGIITTGVQNVFVGTLPNGNSQTVGASEDPRTGVDYPGTDRDITRLTLTADYDFGPAKLTYLGHVANAETFQFLDGLNSGSVSTEIIGAETQRTDDTDLQSHELRLTSSGDTRVSWVVGALLWQEEVNHIDGGFTCVNNTGLAPFNPCAGLMAAVGTTQFSQRNPDPWSRDTDHWSVYGLVDWEILDRLSVILEARYTSEESDYSGPIRDTGGGSRIVAQPGSFLGYLPLIIPSQGTARASDDDAFFLPKATLQWQATDTAMYYLSWAMAAKPSGIAQVPAGLGGFAVTPDGNVDSSRFDREEMTVWELGAKTEWFDRRLVANGSLFFQDYTDKQVSVQVPTPDGTGLLARTANAAGAEVLGLEAELLWFATDFLQLRGSYTFLDTEFTDYKERTTGAANIAQASLNRPDNCTVALNPTSCVLDLSGNELEYAPRHAATAGFTLQNELAGERTVFVEGDLVYQDDRYLDRFNASSLDSYTTFDLRFGIRGAKWSATFYADNLFDDDTIKTAASIINLRDIAVLGGFNGNPPPTTVILPPSVIAILPDQRQFGLRASFRFGGG